MNCDLLDCPDAAEYHLVVFVRKDEEFEVSMPERYAYCATHCAERIEQEIEIGNDVMARRF